jgi:regulator of protease activity HflC (stomatin/prohibitin superfamily)
MQGGKGPRTILIAIGGGVAVLVVLILGISALGTLKAVDPGHVCVVQEGGPLDGRAVAKVRQPGEGVSSIGIFNKQRCFPATQRNYLISSDPSLGDRATVDVFHTPTADSVLVGVEGQALFQLNTAPDVVKDFYRKFGVRTYNVQHPYDSDDGWAAFLAQTFRPVLDNALREQIGKYRCAELNAACALVKGGGGGADTGQNIAQVQDAIGTTLQQDLKQTLGGDYFQNVRFRLQQITLSQKVQDAVDEANAAKAQVSTAQYQVQVAKQRALAARELAKAYQSNPYAGLIEFAKNLPANSQPILNLNIGGGKSPTLAVGK